jgi:hypothetical protein
MPDHAALAGARFELARESGHLRLEPRGRLARRRIAFFRFGQVLMRQRQGEVVRNTPCEIDVLFGEPSRVTREEEQRAEHGAAERDGDAQRRARADHASSRPRIVSAAISLVTSWMM